MRIHITIPFSKDKKLGIEYNKVMQAIPEGDWMCFTDHDVLFLLPDTVRHLYGYVERFPKTGIFTCYTGRVHRCSNEQLLNGVLNDNSDVRLHTNIAQAQTNFLYEATEIKHPVKLSGFLMLISRKTWNKVKFNEERNCLWVDTDFAMAVHKEGKPILRMDGVYVWHSYRLMKDIENKDHLL